MPVRCLAFEACILRCLTAVSEDLRNRKLHRGHTIDELEETCPPIRQEPTFTEEELMRNVAMTHLYVASAEEAVGFTYRAAR